MYDNNSSLQRGWLFDTYRGGWVAQSPPTACAAYRGATIGGRLWVVGGTNTARVMSMRGFDASTDGYIGKDDSTVYTTSATFRKPFAALTGRKVTVGNPTVWYRALAQTDVFTLTVSYKRDADETRSQSVLLTSTETQTLLTQLPMEGLESADVSTLDVTLSLVMNSGTGAKNYLWPPSIDLVHIPYKEQEDLPR